jgi:hypothetical protein
LRALETSFETVTGPHALAYCFHTKIIPGVPAGVDRSAVDPFVRIDELVGAVGDPDAALARVDQHVADELHAVGRFVGDDAAAVRSCPRRRCRSRCPHTCRFWPREPLF